jgi:hypothetical protein
LGVEAFLRAENFSPGEEIITSSIQDVAVSTEDSLYPPPDTTRFKGRPETVFVYLSVEDLPRGEEMKARAERAESDSVFPLFFGRRPGLETLDEQEDHLRKGTNGATGVVKFTLRTRSGEPVPASSYTVDVYGPGTVIQEDGDTVAARKFFVVEG